MERKLSEKEVVMGQLALAAYHNVMTYKRDSDDVEPTDSSIQRKLHEDLEEYLQNDLKFSDYKVFWGPAVAFQPEDSWIIPSFILAILPNLLADFIHNSRNIPMAYMAIVKEKGQSEFTVVIRGTNPLSLYSWLIQDLNTLRQVEWSDVVGETSEPIDSNCKVSRAAQDAVNIHSNLKAWSWYYGNDSKTYTSSEYDLVSYLKDNVIAYKGDLGLKDGEKIKLNFCGHSLGGLLASTLAQWFNDAHAEVAKEFDISVYALAGPTAGNDVFAQRVEKTFYNTLSVYMNENDGATHAWSDMKGYLTILENKTGLSLTGLKKVQLETLPKSDDDIVGMAHCLVDNDQYSGILKSKYNQLVPVTDIPEYDMKYKLIPGITEIPTLLIVDQLIWILKYVIIQHTVPYGLAFESDKCSASTLLSPFSTILEICGWNSDEGKSQAVMADGSQSEQKELHQEVS